VIPQSVISRLQNRYTEGCLRELKVVFEETDFTSNDYLGFATLRVLEEKYQKLLVPETYRNEIYRFAGSTGSRLLSGHSSFYEYVEDFLAKFYLSPSALVFSSGYDANLGVISALASRHDTVICDSLSHASIIDGCRLSFAKKFYKFKHNDLNDLESKLKVATGTPYVIVESVYSMDGDYAPLTEIVSLCEHYGAYVIVDEAHATGIYGKVVNGSFGQGKLVEYGIKDRVLARICTFGKALGCHGAVVLSDNIIKSFLINFCRPFIYSTAPNHTHLRYILASHLLLSETSLLREALKKNTAYFLSLYKKYSELGKINSLKLLPSTSPIQALVINDDKLLLSTAEKLKKNGIDVRPIRAPTVPIESQRLRICLHAFNVPSEIEKLLSLICNE
jgi:8-amino-7-oxononanoate synthase